MANLFSVNSPLWRFMDKVLHLLWLNILWLVFSLPVITLGASTTALYSVTLKYAKDQEGYMTREFFHAFRENFRQSTLAFLLLSGVGVFLGIDLIIYARSSSFNAFSMVLLIAFFTSVLLYLFTSLYVYAVMAKFQNTLPQCLKNALIMSICHWPSSVLMIVIGFTILGIGFLLFPPILFLGFSLFAFLCSKLLVKVFGNYVETDDMMTYSTL